MSGIINRTCRRWASFGGQKTKLYLFNFVIHTHNHDNLLSKYQVLRDDIQEKKGD